MTDPKVQLVDLNIRLLASVD